MIKELWERHQVFPVVRPWYTSKKDDGNANLDSLTIASDSATWGRPVQGNQR